MSLFMPENGFVVNDGRNNSVNPNRIARKNKQFVTAKNALIEVCALKYPLVKELYSNISTSVIYTNGLPSVFTRIVRL